MFKEDIPELSMSKEELYGILEQLIDKKTSMLTALTQVDVDICFIVSIISMKLSTNKCTCNIESESEPYEVSEHNKKILSDVMSGSIQ